MGACVRRVRPGEYDAPGCWSAPPGEPWTSIGAPINHLLRVLGVVTALGGAGLVFVSGYVEEDAPSAGS